MNLIDIRNKLNLGISLSNINLRVTYYVRVSTDNVLQINSLNNQIEYFYEMIKNNSNWEYIDGYIDEGISGTTDYKRDNFMKMIEDAKNDKFDLIITKEISRFSRNTLDSIKYTRKLLSYGVCVLFLNDNINTALPDSELRLTIMASLAQDEVRRLSERVKFGMHRSIKDGTILGNNSLYGYNKVNNKLVIVIEEAEVIKKIFNMYAIDKKSINYIKKYLISKNIKTKQGKYFCVSTITRILRNPKYKGYYCGNKSEVIDYMTKKIKHYDKDEWTCYEDNLKIPPIVEPELWELANKRLDARNKTFGIDYKDKSMYKNRYLLSAKMYCNCHNELYHRKISNNSIYWMSSIYLKNGKKSCISPIIKDEEIMNIFSDIINNIDIDKYKIINTLNLLYNTKDNFKNKITKEIDKFKVKKDNVIKLYIDNQIDDTDYKKYIDLYNSKINLLTLELSNINLDAYNNKDEDLDILFNSTTVRNKIIELLLNKITISKDNDYIVLNILLNYNIRLSNIYKFKRKNKEILYRIYVNY